jgi:hypothetical protein
MEQMIRTKKEAQIMNGGGKFLLNINIPPVKHEIEIHTTEHPRNDHILK